VSTRSAAVLLRSATGADVAAVRALEEELFGADAWSAAGITDALLGADRHAVVAELDDVVAGYAVTRVAGDVADLERIAVHPAYRRAGLASALLDAVRDRAREAAAERLLLEVSEANSGARDFYAAHGAVELDRRRRYYRDASDALVLQLPVGPLGPGEADRG